MTGLVERLGELSPAAVYAVVFAVVFTESAVLIGMFVPTLALLLTAGALAAAAGFDPVLVAAAAAAGVVAGDAVALRTGRLLAARLRGGRVGRRVPEAAWLRTEALVERHGGRAVLVCRFLPVLRTLAPHLAGAGGLTYRGIAPWSALGAVVWAGAEVTAGYLAGPWVERLIALSGTVLAVAAVVVGGAAVIWAVRRRGDRGGATSGSGGRPCSTARFPCRGATVKWEST